jgi:hypothetical protein
LACPLGQIITINLGDLRTAAAWIRSRQRGNFAHRTLLLS